MTEHPWSLDKRKTLGISYNLFLLRGVEVMIWVIPVYLFSVTLIIIFLFALFLLLVFLEGIQIILIQYSITIRYANMT